MWCPASRRSRPWRSWTAAWTARWRACARDPCHIFYPGVKETLTELHKTHRLFIVSNCQQGYIELLMEKGGLGGLISDFDCFGNTGLPKGQTLRLLCERCNVRDAVYVGDTQGDMEASEQAGLPFVWAAYGFGKPRALG